MNYDKTNTRNDRRMLKPVHNSPIAGKLPPQAIDLEVAVLGALMLIGTAIDDVGDILKPEVFYTEAHQKIYTAIRSLQTKGDPIDIRTVTAELRHLGLLEIVGGAFYITELTAGVASAANIEYHSRIIIQKYIQREMIGLSIATIDECYDDTADIFHLLSQYEIKKDNFLGTVTTKKEISNAALFDETIESLQQVRFAENGITGVASGFPELDQYTGGWQRSDLIILAARPGMGKTSFLLTCVDNAAIRSGKPVAVFSLEQSSQQLMQKQLAIETSIPLEKFKKAKLDTEDWSRIMSFKDELSKAQIHWDDTPALNILEFRAKCRRLKAKHDIQLIVVDYLQLMSAKAENKNSNREQEISRISATLKSVAKELNVPVIALSQLSRAVESRPGHSKRPMLSDLRESGSLEQDADQVLFIYRPEYYGLEFDEDNNSTDGMAEVIMAKNRHGATGDVCLKFNKKTTAFENYASLADMIPKPELPHSIVIRPSNNWNVDDDAPF